MLPLSPQLQVQAKQVVQYLQEQGISTASLQAAELAALTLSDFIVDNLRTHPEWWCMLCSQSPSVEEGQTYGVQLSALLATVEDEATLMRTLRLFRRHMLMRIAWGQALCLCSTEETLNLLSKLAEVLIIAARDWLYQVICQEWGTPYSCQGEPQPLLVLGMGKLGGGELNFSSDVDLILVYPENGVTQGGSCQRDNVEFFTRLGQRLIKVLDQPMKEGVVYRVDMRLRPFGNSGPLVLSFAALEDYYQEQGRDWERYAMIKARLLGDTDIVYGQELSQLLRPFVFRRYIDCSVIQSLRNMKGMITREVRRRALTGNIKLGAGGIREIEFITQVFQLIRGGREPSLQNKSLLLTLQAISDLALLSSDQVASLREHYLFLRRLENLLQAIADQQTQTLPTDELNQARLAWGMGYGNWTELFTTLQKIMAEVRQIFNTLIGEDPLDTIGELEQGDLRGLWFDDLDADELARLLPEQAPEIRQVLWRTICDFRVDMNKRTIGPRGRDALDQLVPPLLAEICGREDAGQVLPRLTYLLLSIVSRTPYLELLVENQQVLQHLIRLCAASPMVSHQLARYPLLLDELLDINTLYHPTPLSAYRSELRQYLLRVPEDDDEQQLEALRQFKQIQQLRIAAADIAGVLPVMQVSDHLTYLAEALIDEVVQRAWTDVVKRYGLPKYLQESDGRGFAVLGYGKLGGWELGYSSDLDLVFLHDWSAGVITERPYRIDARQFYLRLVQRIIHLFNVRTSSGILYKVDARLRPSGESGLLVSTFDAFVDYQQHDAWTWEHQALVRARMVYGGDALKQRFDSIRHDILSYPRDEASLRQKVRDMREKMSRYLGSNSNQVFDLKTDRGGITDIEFIAQYLVLRFSAEQPQLTRCSDNVRIFELMARGGVLDQDEASALCQAYVAMRDEIHRLFLQECPRQVVLERFTAERAQVNESWIRWLGESK